LNDDDVFVVVYVDGSIKVWVEVGEIGTRKERKARVYAAREMADSFVCLVRHNARGHLQCQASANVPFEAESTPTIMKGQRDETLSGSIPKMVNSSHRPMLYYYPH
jgi:hypothetical protein